MVWLTLQNIAQKTVRHSSYHQDAEKSPCCRRTYGWRKERLLPWLFAVWGGGVNRSTERLGLVACVPLTLGLRSRVLFWREDAPWECACCHRAPAPLISGRLTHVSSLSPPRVTCLILYLRGSWRFNSVLEWDASPCEACNVPEPKRSLSPVKWLWYIDKWSWLTKIP